MVDNLVLAAHKFVKKNVHAKTQSRKEKGSIMRNEFFVEEMLCAFAALREFLFRLRRVLSFK